jgi:hypothetical protein
MSWHAVARFLLLKNLATDAASGRSPGGAQETETYEDMLAFERQRNA